ncbi:hypothetical protein OE88DRAFT_25783 [Heliocybe sulcata]|uniref:Uncharacterized protein n=1 Tax=Heliocybe sulcata TaxID=5364 RepID=A0A5C3NGN7_9AGAM|nr:hypothetical protein OE88DRAFT_25783 [Heliocybe sulcata]
MPVYCTLQTASQPVDSCGGLTGIYPVIAIHARAWPRYRDHWVYACQWPGGHHVQSSSMRNVAAATALVLLFLCPRCLPKEAPLRGAKPAWISRLTALDSELGVLSYSIINEAYYPSNARLPLQDHDSRTGWSMVVMIRCGSTADNVMPISYILVTCSVHPSGTPLYNIVFNACSPSRVLV